MKPLEEQLKEIRDKAHPDIYENGEGLGYFTETVEEIQSETYKLGRSEVIDEIEKYINGRTQLTNLEMEVFKNKLNNLKK